MYALLHQENKYEYVPSVLTDCKSKVLSNAIMITRTSFNAGCILLTYIPLTYANNICLNENVGLTMAITFVITYKHVLQIKCCQRQQCTSVEYYITVQFSIQYF